MEFSHDNENWFGYRNDETGSPLEFNTLSSALECYVYLRDRTPKKISFVRIRNGEEIIKNEAINRTDVY